MPAVLDVRQTGKANETDTPSLAGAVRGMQRAWQDANI